MTEVSQLEAELCRIWADVLGLPEVDPHARFFELGGDSLAAETVFEEIAAQLGQEHSSMLLLECRTPAELARRLVQPTENEALLAVQPNGARPPLFIIHDLVGDVFYARRLSEHLGPGQPVFAITPPLGEGAQVMLSGRLEDLTHNYVDAVIRLWPHGPYRLFGYSLGGVLAFQMAVELQARGGTVDLLALGDSAAPSILPEDIATIDPDVLLFGAERVPMMERLRRGVTAWPRALRDAGPRGVAPLLLHAARAQASYLRWRVSATGRARTRFTRTFRGSVRYPLAHRLAVLSREYHPATRFAGSALLIRTRENMDAWGMAPAADRGWSAHVEGAVTTVMVPCLHDDLGREPYLGMLARILQPALAAERS